MAPMAAQHLPWLRLSTYVDNKRVQSLVVWAYPAPDIVFVVIETVHSDKRVTLH